ncbi:MAG: SIS domain-containing protein [Anaerolineae bacterium]|nr:SIS domain-containing protein [Anaerolineae bacterium]
MQAAQGVVEKIQRTQVEPLNQAAGLCANAILQGGLVHLFGTGHSRMPVEEIFPRHGSFPGFHPIVELSMTFHTQVVGANGQRQAMFIERMPGLGEVILNNFLFRPHDVFIIFSNSGVNNVVIEVAQGVKQRGMALIGVVSVAHCQASAPQHASGLRLTDLSDIVLDNCTPAGDAMVQVDGLAEPVGPGSTLGYAVLVNALKSGVAERLTQAGQPPLVLTSSVLVGAERSAELFERAYDDYRARMAQVFTG